MSTLDPAWRNFPELNICPSSNWNADNELELIELGWRVSGWLNWPVILHDRPG